MRIVIADRFRPFSHRPGTRCLVPGTALLATCYPTKIVLHNLLTGEVETREHPLDAPCDRFTVIQDLEKGRVQIERAGRCGFFRHFLEGNPPERLERLSFGSSKKLDWELVHRRCDLREIFPIWHRLALMTPEMESEGESLASRCDTELQSYLDLYRAGFESLLAPRAEDAECQGFALSPASHPLAVVGAGRRLRRLFLDEARILPHLPPQFPAGRLTGAQTPFGSLDLEWTKKQVRQMILEVTTEDKVKFEFRHDLKTFRLRRSPKDLGESLSVDDPIEGQPGSLLYFDRFER